MKSISISRCIVFFNLALFGLTLPATGHASEPRPPKGFRALFDARDLTGWHGLNPHTAANLTGDKKKTNLAQQRAEFPKFWTVAGGELINDGHGPYAATDEEFGDIELLLEYKTVAGADSGIYLRGTPQVQIWDWNQVFNPKQPTRRPHLGSGGLFNNTPGTTGRDPLVRADRPFGQWNQFRIRQVGDLTWVWLNDKLVVDGAVMENFWDRSQPLPVRGPIMLQTHGGEIRWRNIFVRDIGTAEAKQILSATAAERKASLSRALTLRASFDEGLAEAQEQSVQPVKPGQLLAGVAKVEITNKQVLPIVDPLYVKALVLKHGPRTAVIVTVDAVAIGEIGYIGNDYLGKVRARIKKELGIAPENVMVNASHCHAKPCADVDDKTVQAVTEATQNLVPVTVGVGVGFENRISENRRLKLKNGKEVDVRHAYSLPPDEEIAEVGPIDPHIGVLRLDRKDGRTLAVVYNFACHPIMGLPKSDNTADIVGFASRVIEDNLSDGTIALFVQGCAGDINPVLYKDVSQPRNAEPLGNMLGLSVLKAVRKIKCVKNAPLTVIHEKLGLPRADNTKRIEAMLLEQAKLLKLLKGTSLNLRTFLPLVVKYNASAEFPSYYSHRYLHEKKMGRDDLTRLDEANRRTMKAYMENIYIMEALTRLQTNLALLRKHQETNRLAEMKPLEVEVVGMRVGDFVLITFPGELTVEVGLSIKKTSPHKHTYVAGYTNGYIYYTPTAKQLENVGGAQEDSDCLLAPAWQKTFQDHVARMLKKL